jgi:hypothetical protein
MSFIFIVVGVQLIGNRVVAEAQEKVRHDRNAAWEIYLSRLNHIDNVVRFTADRIFLIGALPILGIGTELVPTGSLLTKAALVVK